jgi:hypothetical protein
MRIQVGFVQALGVIMLALGAIALAASIIYTSTILAFTGLGLVFWGALLLYIKPEEYTKKRLLEAALSPPLATLNQIIQKLGYKGNATYLPPKYFTNPETTKIYIPKHTDANLPTPEQVQKHENQPIARTTQGILITPPGIQLAKLLEKTLGTTFIKTNLKNLQQQLPREFIENLEIAENLEIHAEDPPTQNTTQNTTIHVKMTRPFYTDASREAEEPSHTASVIGGPICSAIAIALTKATGKPVRITDTKTSADGYTLEATYTIIEE